MGILDSLKKKVEDAKADKEAAPAAKGKYEEVCALCGAGNTEKKWMGQYWHKKCIRSAKKASKKMI
ncbi:MAG: hypothetical protein PHH08_03545 [Candidatus ainarchaeum sp.]|nr:hypothetical protein [Candidatus ainarchaeum sp.]